MKGNKNHFIKSQEIFSVLVLSGILSLSTGLTLLQTANAAVSNASAKGEKIKGELLISDRGRGGDDDKKRDRSDDKSEREDDRNRGNDDQYEDDRNRGNDDQYEDDQGEDKADRLPRTVANAVRQDLSRKVGIAPGKLKIINYSRETWSDGCLGLGTAAELCLLAQVEGWRVVLSDGRFSWVYRTDLQGLVLRLENQIAANLPPAVANAVLQAASQQTKLPVSKLRIIGAEQREWSDGCLGLAKPDEICTLAIVPGWLVTVEVGQQKLVYRTNADGSVVRLDEAATAAMLNPVPLKANLPPLQKDVIFREITSGGIANITYEINLFKDGRVIRSDGTTSNQIKQVSEQQVDQFKKLLKKQDFEQFSNLSYPAPSGAVDYMTVTFTSRKGTTRYTDISQDRLPSSLRAVIQAWGELTAVQQF